MIANFGIVTMVIFAVQPTAVNNWTKLAVGMLNADAEMTQQVRRAEQNQHLARREAYLDGLIAANYGGGAETWVSLCDYYLFDSNEH